MVFVEADSDGGVLAVRYGLAQGRQAPGLASLTAATRREAEGEQLWNHTRQLAGGLEAVVAPTAPDEASGVLGAGGEQLGRWLAGLEAVDVIVDCGRLSAHSPSLPLAVAAGRLLVVARPRVEDLAGVAHRLRALQATGVALGLVLVGESPYGPDEVAASLGVEVLGVVAHDPRAAAALEGAGWDRRLRWSLLARSAHSLALRLAERDLGSRRHARPKRSWLKPEVRSG